MTKRSKAPSRKTPTQRPAAPEKEPASDHPLEKDNAVEWGDRLQTGKRIARGGKQTGAVPGATEQSTH